MSRTTFREFLTALSEANSYCDGIKDPVIRKACKNLNKKSYKVRMYGVGLGGGLNMSGTDGDSGGSGGGDAGGGAGGGGE